VERIAIFAALQWECRAVLRHLRGVRRQSVGRFTCWIGQAPQREVWVMKTGVGVRRAALAAEALAATAEFAAFFSTGCAGGLAPELRPGDLAVATALRGHGLVGDLAVDCAQRERAAVVASAAGLRPALGPILCSATVLARVEEKRAAAAGGAIAVEMEGGPIAARAAACRVPFVAVRAVLDAADDELQVAAEVIDRSRGTVRPLKLAGHVAANPGAIGGLIALSRLRRAARYSLEQFFDHWLATPA
jgi:adenosylhomocysteine nucleosidase